MTASQPLEPGSVANRPLPFLKPRGILKHRDRWEYRIQDGFWLSCLDIESGAKLRLEYEKDRPALNFGFILSGRYINRIKAPGLDEREFLNNEGASGILYLPRQDGELIIPGHTRIRVVHIHLSLSVFFDLFHTEASSVPKLLKPLLDGPVDRAYAFRAGMTMRVRSALDRLLKGPSPGAPARLFYQGIALDLIAGQIARANTLPNCPGKMGFDDRDRVVFARDLLVRDLTSPPCLKQLSRKTGLNMNKLQQGFYQLYGVSVFKYLRRYRMQEANRFFHETDMNVSQAAAAVGYTNVSHFSSAYKKQFDILPKEHLTILKG